MTSPDQLRRLDHPGAPSFERRSSVVAAGRWKQVLLRGGLSVTEAVAAAFSEAGFDGGFVRLSGLRLSQLRYVIPAASDGIHAAWYSETFAPPGAARIDEAGAIVGWRDGDRFLHCHGAWTPVGGARRMGHLLPHDSIVDSDTTVAAFGVSGATFEAEDDTETGFKLFAPKAASRFSGGAGRAILCTVRPNEDICFAIETICRDHGLRRANVHGIGSLVGADFEAGDHVSSYATEVLVREGSVVPTEDGPRCRLDIALVGMDGAIASGVLLRGRNPVCVTFELLIEEWRDEE